MAKRNSMSRARQSRNASEEPIPQSGNKAASESIGEPAPGWAPRSNLSNLREIVGDERKRLMKAQAVLGCVAFALLYEDWLEEPNRPCFADAVAAVEDLVAETVERLGTGASP